MKIIDQLVVLLGLDTKGMEEGAKNGKEGLSDFEKEARRVANEVKEQGRVAGEFYTELIEKAAAFFAVIAGGMELKEFVHHTLEAEVSAGRLAKMIDVDVVEMQTFANATRMFGGSAQEAMGNIEFLAKRIQILGTTIRGAKMAAMAFQQLGLSEAEVKGKKVFDVLDMISKKVSDPKMTGIKATAYLERLGQGPAMVRMLRDREKMAEMIELMKKLGVATAFEVHQATELEEAEAKNKIIGESVGRTIMTMIVPAMELWTAGLEKLAIWAKKHGDVVKAVFISVAVAAGVASVAVLALTVSLSPIMLTIAGISLGVGLLAGALYLLYENADNWLPRLNDMFTGLGDVVGDVAHVIGDAWDAIKSLFSGDDIAQDTAWNNLWEDMKTTALNAIDEIVFAIVHIPEYAAKGLRAGFKVGKSKMDQGWVHDTLQNPGVNQALPSWFRLAYSAAMRMYHGSSFNSGESTDDKIQAELARHREAMRQRGGEVPPSVVPPQSSLRDTYQGVDEAGGAGINVNIFTDSQDPYEHGHIVKQVLEGMG